MKPLQFNAVCRELFRGWNEVETFEEGLDHFVRLRVSVRRLEAARGDESRLLGQLFDQARLEDLAKRIERNARMRGLRRYGRRK